MEELVDVQLHPTDLSKTTKVGVLLPPDLRKDFKKFLAKNADVFAWSHEDMPRIYPSFMVHRLNVDPNHKVMQQRRRVFTSEIYEVIRLEMEKLKKGKFIDEIICPS